jgi:hypothetical protein
VSKNSLAGHNCCGAREFLTIEELGHQYKGILADFLDTAAEPRHGMIFDIEPGFNEIAIVLAEGMP